MLDHEVDAEPGNQFEGGDGRPVPRQGEQGERVGGRAQAHQGGFAPARHREQLQARRRDDPEGPLRSHEEMLHIVAGVVLAELAEARQHAAIGEHHFEPQHEIARVAVMQHGGAPGVGRWTLAAWSCLTVGITLGSFWAYYELGWGGWWFWDPVENASFMPWLVGTALLHSAIVTEKRGALAGWTVFLAISAFTFSMLGMFLVRSGF